MAKTDRKLYRLYYERYKLLALNMFRIIKASCNK